MARSRPRLRESAAARCDGGWARESLCSIFGLKRLGAKGMKRLMDTLVVVGATILTGGGGYVVVLGSSGRGGPFRPKFGWHVVAHRNLDQCRRRSGACGLQPSLSASRLCDAGGVRHAPSCAAPFQRF
jgi:hypothetical protein